MLFILIMEVLSSLIQNADNRGLLSPLAPTQIGHRMSIYADDVVLFASPATEELAFIKTILDKFGQASGLRVNLNKSSIVPIHCAEEQATQVGPANIWDYRCPYGA